MLKRKNKNAAPPRPRLLAATALAVMLGIGGLAAVQPALADEGGNTTDVTIQVSNEDGNIAWSAPTVVPMKATAAGTLIGPNADALSIRNLSAFPIRVKTMDAQAVDPFHLVADADKSDGNNDFQMSMNGVTAAGAVELADDGTWAMGYAGNADGSDVLPLTVSAAKIARVTADLSTAKKAATITWTVEPTEHAVKQTPQPDPENGVAYAVYSADDKSLNLYKRDSKPEVGDTFNGKAVTKVVDIDEADASGGVVNEFTFRGLFHEVASAASKVEVVDSGIKPVSTALWLCSFSSATSMDVVKLDTSSVTNMSKMFCNCYKLANLDLSGWDFSNVTNMKGTFCNCYGLASLDVSSWGTSSVTDMNSMFGNCSSLASLDVSGWDTSSVTDMNSLFTGCSDLASLDVSGWDTSKVTDMSWMFSTCLGLTSLDVSGWDTSKVTDMSSMFFRCSNLTADCSNLDVSNVTSHREFNTEASGVIAPKWNG